MSITDFGSKLDSYMNGITNDWMSKLSDTDAANKILEATILAIDGKFVHVDAGLKQEGKVSLHEFSVNGVLPDLQVGGKVQVYRESASDGQSISFSHTRARKEFAWSKLEKLYNTKKTSEGVVVSHAKGGFVVEIFGAPVFLPAKQLDIQGDIIGKNLELRIVRMDRSNMSITAARKQAIESDDECGVQIGEIVTAIITAVSEDMLILEYKNIKLNMASRDYLYDYADDLRSEFSVGQSLRVKVINIDKTTIKVGHKQLLTDPWIESIQYAGVSVGSMLEATVDKIQNSGVQLLLDTKPVLSAYLPADEISWSKKPIALVDAVKLDQKYTVYVTNIDKKRKIMFVSLRKCNANPLVHFAQKNTVGDTIEGTVKDVTALGTIIKFKHEVEGIAQNVSLEIGKHVKATISAIDAQKNVLIVSVSEESDKKFDAWELAQLNTVMKFKISQITEYTVLLVNENGLQACIKRNDLDAYEYKQDALLYVTILEKDAKQKMLIVGNQMDV